MKITKILLLILLGLSTLTSYSQDQNERLQNAFKDLRGEGDKFTQKVSFYDKRVDVHHLMDDGMFAGLNQVDGGYMLKLVVYHQLQMDKNPDVISQISIRAGDTTFNLKSKIMGNGTRFATTTLIAMGHDQTNYVYNILHRIIISGEGGIRFYTAENSAKDYTLSKREIKELKTVVEAWAAYYNLQ